MPTPASLPYFALIAASASTLLLAGCGVSSSGVGKSSPGGLSQHAISGSVHGGQQPVVGASIQLYAAGKTGLYSAPRAMLTTPVTTDNNGAFNITGDYTCQSGDQVYIVGSGGTSNPNAGINPAIVLMTALGPCSALTASIYISINEVTTVGSVYALQQFMRAPATAMGANTSSLPQAHALAAAFASVHNLVDPTFGVALQTAPGNGIVPTAAINSLADSLAACVNSAAGSLACTTLFADTTAGVAPADTAQAALNLAVNPSLNPGSIFMLGNSSPPFEPTLTSAPATWALTVAHPSDVLTFHNDISRDGVQSYESTLTPANVNSSSFGKLFTFNVDSYLFAQPLYAGGIGMPDGAVHNLILAASTQASVYAFDADGNNPAAGQLWHVNLIPSGERFPTQTDYGCPNPPEGGIVGTPVIDRASETLYVVVKSVTTDGSTYTHRLHALSLIDGSEQPNSPAVINPTFATNGDAAGAVGNVIPFNGQTQNQRSALLLASDGHGGQTVWINYASHCDIAPYHGDLLGFNAANVSQLTATFNNTPNGDDGGIWMSNGGPAADSSGAVYMLAGNGTFDAVNGGPDYGDSATKILAPAPGAASTAVTVASYFTPSDQLKLSNDDLDLGGAEAILVHDPASTVAPNLLIGSDKNGYIYLLNSANMGGYDNGTHGPDSLNADLEDFPTNSGSIYNFAFFNNTLYTSQPLAAYPFTPGGPGTAGSLATAPSASTSLNPAPAVASANGTADGIIWVQSSDGVLHAFTPALSPLYDTTQAPSNRDTPPAAWVKFTSPVIANGKVFLSGQGSLSVYGLLQ